MNDVTREQTAKHLLHVFRTIWCNRETDEEPYFNCAKCEFEMYGKCAVNIFLHSTKYEIEYPQGVIVEGDTNV